jgi:hypothetical protein
MGFPLPAPFPTKRTEETIHMKAIVVTDQAAGTAGMKLVERMVRRISQARSRRRIQLLAGRDRSIVDLIKAWW